MPKLKLDEPDVPQWVDPCRSDVDVWYRCEASCFLWIRSGQDWYILLANGSVILSRNDPPGKIRRFVGTITITQE